MVVTTLPESSTAAQNVPGHEIAVMSWPGSTLVTVQAELPPVGLVEVMTFPSSSPATHNDVVGQEIALRALSPSMWANVQVGDVLVGLTETNAAPPSEPPSPSIATQSDAEAHEIPTIEEPPVI